MTAISIHELHEHTDLWVRKATDLEPIVVTADGVAVAKAKIRGQAICG